MYYSKTKKDKFIECLIHNIVMNNLIKLLRIMKLNGKLLATFTSIRVFMGMLNSALERCFSLIFFLKAIFIAMMCGSVLQWCL